MISNHRARKSGLSPMVREYQVRVVQLVVTDIISVPLA